MERTAEPGAIPKPKPERPVSVEVSVFHLYLLRALYLLIAVGQGIRTWPEIVHHAHVWSFWEGVGYSMLGALTLLSLLGVRYPLRMLPLLFFELTWKSIWMLSVALPQWSAHHVDADLTANIFAIGLGVVLCPIAIPWRYTFANYVRTPGDRWR